MSGRPQNYGTVAKSFHWLTAVAIITMFVIAEYMISLPPSLDKLEVYNLHKSIGVTILAVTLLRVVWRQLNPPPALPAGMKKWEQLAAHSGHILLYGLLFVIPVAGIVHSWAGNYPIVVFGLFTIPSPIEPNKALFEVMAATHLYAGWAMIATFVIHIGAVIKHHFVAKDDVLRRMTVGTNS